MLKMYQAKVQSLADSMQNASKIDFRYPPFCYAKDKVNLEKRLTKNEFITVCIFYHCILYSHLIKSFTSRFSLIFPKHYQVKYLIILLTFLPKTASTFCILQINIILKKYCTNYLTFWTFKK